MESQCSRNRLGSATRIAVGEDHDEAVKSGLTIGTKYPVLASCRFAHRKDRLALRNEPLCEFRGQRQIIRRGTGAKINNDIVHFFCSETAQSLFKRLKVGVV